MPILYTCVLNKDKRFIISQALGSKQTGNFHDLVLAQCFNFEIYGQKKIVLDAELALCYRDKNGHSYACIKSSYDVSDLEAQRFLEKLENYVVEFLETPETDAIQVRSTLRGNQSLVISDYVGSLEKKRDGMSASLVQAPFSDSIVSALGLPRLNDMTMDNLKDPRYTQTFGKLRNGIEKLCKDWNNNPDNRDKSVTVLKNLNQTKEEFIQSMREMLERDSKIDVLQEKTEQINV